jgi:molybdopterin molybdotransferase
MLHLHQALAIVNRTLAGLRQETETLATGDALGRTLAADQFSRLDLPPFDKSAMDGYALLAGDRRET